MMMQVHDELVFDVSQAEMNPFKAVVKKEMESAFSMKVPLVADTFTGQSWYKN